MPVFQCVAFCKLHEALVTLSEPTDEFGDSSPRFPEAPSIYPVLSDSSCRQYQYVSAGFVAEFRVFSMQLSDMGYKFYDAFRDLCVPAYALVRLYCVALK